MKFLQKIGVAALLLGAAVQSQAQMGFDAFNPLRSYVLAAPQNIGYAAAGLTTITNQIVDVGQGVGIGVIDIVVETNTGATGGTLTFSVQASPDMTNWVNLANSQLVSSYTTLNITNAYWYLGTNGAPSLIATNLQLLPGVLTYPSATLNSYVTPYVLPLPKTNTFPTIALQLGYSKIGFNIKDNNRYLRTLWYPGGTVTNFTASALLTIPQAAQ